MFCGNCGKQIDNNSSFCPYCGASVNGNTGHKPKHKNDNKIKRIVVVALIVLAIAIVAIKGFAIYKSRPTEEQLLAEVNNYQNGGIVTSDGTWLYYNDNGLCKMLLKDGTKQKVLSNDINPEKMYLAGDQIYYFSNLEFYKTKVNKPKEEKLEFMSIFSEDGFQMDGNNYYYYETNSPEGVYSAKASNTKKKKMLTDILPTKILMYKDYLYVISGYTTIDDVENPNYGTWRIDKNGKNKIALTGICPEYMVFSGDTIYYTDEDGTLCSMALDGSQQEKYNGITIKEGLNVTDEYVFYLKEDDDDWYKTRIHRVNKDGTNDIELNVESSENINVLGDWLFYTNCEQNYEIYKMSFDGEYNEPIY